MTYIKGHPVKTAALISLCLHQHATLVLVRVSQSFPLAVVIILTGSLFKGQRRHAANDRADFGNADLKPAAKYSGKYSTRRTCVL